jgi:glycosyltransferase involved in cell wall biosynthesis
VAKILICDFNVGPFGHNLGYIQNFYQYIKSNQTETQFVFLLNSKAKEVFKVPAQFANIQVEFVEENLFNSFDDSNQNQKFLNQWNYIVDYGIKNQISRLILMMFDAYQNCIGNSITPFKISTIYFLAYYRMSKPNAGLIEKTQLWLRKMRKKWIIKKALKNQSLDRVYILNDEKAVEEGNSTIQNVFRYLSDPILEYPQKEGLVIREKHKISDNKIIFLIFGAIDERKNVTNLLKAFQQISSEKAAKSTLLVIGKVEKVFQEHFVKLISDTKNLKPELQLITENRFVDDEEMESYFSQSDVILRMNLNYFNSSGVLGNAAKYNKPSLVSDYGLVAELTQNYHLGKLANPENIVEIKDALIEFIENPTSRNIDGTTFSNLHHKDNIYKSLLLP